MTQPKTSEAELALLGAVLFGWQHPSELDVAPADFYQPAHAAVWEAILDIEEAGNMPDPSSVAVALDGHTPPIDPMWVMGLTAAAPVAANAPYYAEQVRTASGLRELGTAALHIQQLASSGGHLEQVREQARQRIDEACRSRVSGKTPRLNEILDATLSTVRDGKQDVLTTGWPDLDRIIGGLAPGRLIVIGARPGGGKSLACNNITLHIANRYDRAVLFASLEMPKDDVIKRLVSTRARVDLSSLMNNRVSPEDWAKIERIRADINALPIHVEDDSSLTIQALRRKARDVRRSGDDLAVIIVDYLQLMQPAPASRRNSSRAEEISQIARDLKRLARETNACVVAAAQINREGGKNDKGPRLTDLREGGIENDADVVVLMHRPDEDIPEIQVAVAKNRHGPMANLTLNLVGHYAELVSIARPFTPSGPPHLRAVE